MRAVPEDMCDVLVWMSTVWTGGIRSVVIGGDGGAGSGAQGGDVSNDVTILTGEWVGVPVGAYLPQGDLCLCLYLDFLITRYLNTSAHYFTKL